MCNQRPGTEEAVHTVLEPPPDSWAAHVDELPKPGSRVFAAQNALALALIYASMDPEVRQEVDNLRDDVQKLASQNENLDAYSRMMYLAACQAQEGASTFQGQAATLTQKVKTTSKQLQDAQQEISNANERARCAFEERDASVAEAGELRRQLQDAIAELKTAASERDAGKEELRLATTATEEGTKNAISVVSQLQAEIKRLRDERRANRAEIETFFPRLRDAQNLGQTVSTEKMALVSELDVVRIARDALAQSNGQLSKDLLELRGERDVLRRQLRDTESQRDALEAKCDGLEKQCGELETRNSELASKSGAVAAAAHTLRLGLRSFQEEKKALEDRLREQESKRTELETECGTVRTERNDSKAALDKLRSEHNLLARRQTALQDDRLSLQGERDTLLAKLRDAEKTIEAERAQRATARAAAGKERDVLTAQLAASQDMCKNLVSVKTALHDAQRKAEACNANREAAEAEVNRLQHELGAAGQLAEAWSAKFRDAERKRGALQKDVETSTEECRRLRKDLTSLKKSIKDEKSLPQQRGTSTDEVKQLEAQIGQLRNSVVFWKAKSQITIKALSAEQERRKTLDAKLKAECAEKEHTLALDDMKRDAVSSERDALLREKDVLPGSRDAMAAKRGSLNNEIEYARGPLVSLIDPQNLDLEAELVEMNSMKNENTRLTQKIEKLNY